MAQQVLLVGLALIATTFAQFSILPYPENSGQTQRQVDIVQNEDYGTFGSRDQGQGFRDQGQGFRDQGGQGFRDQGQGFRDQGGQGFRVQGGQGFRDQGQGFRDQGQGFRDQGQGFRDQGQGFQDQRPNFGGSYTPQQGYNNNFDFRNPYNTRDQNRGRELFNGRGPAQVDSSYNGRPIIQPPRPINDPSRPIIQPPRLINDPPRPIVQPPRLISDPPKPYNSHGPAPVQGRRPGGYGYGRNGGSD